MNERQREYFRQKLLAWRAELLDEANQTIANLSTESLHKPDQMDRAQIESAAALDLRTRDRERKLLQKIESALRRIEDGTFGYCSETDEPISLARLKHGLLPLCHCRHKNNMNAWNVSTATIRPEKNMIALRSGQLFQRDSAGNGTKLFSGEY